MYCTAQYDANAGMHANVACHACQSHPNVSFARVCVSTCAATSAKGGRLPLRTSERTDSLRDADDADVDGDDEDDEDARRLRRNAWDTIVKLGDDVLGVSTARAARAASSAHRRGMTPSARRVARAGVADASRARGRVRCGGCG